VQHKRSGEMRFCGASVSRGIPVPAKDPSRYKFLAVRVPQGRAAWRGSHRSGGFSEVGSPSSEI
jgi:hypothetical protein